MLALGAETMAGSSQGSGVKSLGREQEGGRLAGYAQETLGISIAHHQVRPSARLDGFSDFLHQSRVEPQVMQGRQSGAEGLCCLEKVPKIGGRIRLGFWED